MSSILRTAASVRSVDAPSGRRIDTKNAPWSSFGKKPDGKLRNNPPVSSVNATQCDDREGRSPDQKANRRHVFAIRPIEAAVE